MEVNREYISGGDDINEIVLTVILTLFLHSFIGTVIYIASRENEDIAAIWAIGIIGWFILGFSQIVMTIQKLIKHYTKRAIVENEDTGIQYWCYSKDVDDLCNWRDGWKVIGRYMAKDKWQNLNYVGDDVIQDSKRNCDHCKYDESCTFDMYRASLDKIRCEHDIFGIVTKFDKFEKK